MFVFLHVNCFSLKTLAHILARYTAWIWGLLKVLGIWGVFVIAFADSALLGMPIDAIVATYVYQHRSQFFAYVLLASVGSALGSIPLYIVGYIGGEAVLRKRISAERFEKIHRSFEDHAFWALMFPGMFPPPMPFKIFVLGAAVSEMNFGHFLLAIFVGRCVRFSALALLTLWFGPQIAELGGALIRHHLYWVAAFIIAAGLLAWIVVRTKKTRAKRQAAQG